MYVLHHEYVQKLCPKIERVQGAGIQTTHSYTYIARAFPPDERGALVGILVHQTLDI